MRIDVVSDDGFGAQTRAYAEFRVFSALARFSDLVDDARVLLLRPAAGSGGVVCRIAVTLNGQSPALVAARGRHPSDAIDRAATRAGALLRRYHPIALSS